MTSSFVLINLINVSRFVCNLEAVHQKLSLKAGRNTKPHGFMRQFHSVVYLWKHQPSVRVILPSLCDEPTPLADIITSKHKTSTVMLDSYTVQSSWVRKSQFISIKNCQEIFGGKIPPPPNNIQTTEFISTQTAFILTLYQY